MGGLMHLRAHFRDDMTGVQLLVGYAEQPHHSALRALLVEPVVFNAPCTQLRFPAARLKTKLDGDPHLGQLAGAQLEEQLQAARQAAQRQLPDEVRARLSARLHRSASIESVARDLRMSARTLQRQLGSFGVSFHQLLDEVRCAQALHYLSKTDEGVDRIAERLGYGDASSFRRAFRRWTGIAPASYRAKRGAQLGLSHANAAAASDARPLAGNGSAA